jgi:phytanoyl-CoA hydroxylase
MANNGIYIALHELDPVFGKATLDNERLISIARDLKFHQAPK